MKNKTLAKTALLAALSIIFGYIEHLLPLPIPVYGAKIGISNIVIMTSLYLLPGALSWGILLIKVFVSSLLFSGFSAFLYSLSGGVLSLIIMQLLKRNGKFGIIGISVAGAVSHNIGQLICARLILSSLNVWVYLPMLIFIGIISGIIIGVLAELTLKRLANHL